MEQWNVIMFVSVLPLSPLPSEVHVDSSMAQCILLREGSEANVGTTVSPLCRTSLLQRSATFWPMQVCNNLTFVITSVNRYGTNLTVNALLKTTLSALRRHSRDVCSKMLQNRQLDTAACNLSVSP
jgi:hypothetical protein